ncbi:hypothetical protein C8R44DRAFT_781043 [Mycena epipterygia]|nr:hypothetical protein C8R44DRAFT_781043 [Mycena epipterygia]
MSDSKTNPAQIAKAALEETNTPQAEATVTTEVDPGDHNVEAAVAETQSSKEGPMKTDGAYFAPHSDGMDSIPRPPTPPL